VSACAVVACVTLRQRLTPPTLHWPHGGRAEPGDEGAADRGGDVTAAAIVTVDTA
jgi:hypothetical protein